MDLYSPTAPTIARKEAARAAREAYEKRKTKQVAATRVVRAASVTRAAPALQHREAPPAVSASDPAASSTASQAAVPVAGSAPGVTTKEVAVARILEAAAGGASVYFCAVQPQAG
jgi:hypothetical protein